MESSVEDHHSLIFFFNAFKESIKTKVDVLGNKVDVMAANASKAAPEAAAPDVAKISAIEGNVDQHMTP